MQLQGLALIWEVEFVLFWHFSKISIEVHRTLKAIYWPGWILLYSIYKKFRHTELCINSQIKIKFWNFGFVWANLEDFVRSYRKNVNKIIFIFLFQNGISKYDPNLFIDQWDTKNCSILFNNNLFKNSGKYQKLFFSKIVLFFDFTSGYQI